MSMHSFFVFLAQHSLELTVAVFAITISFVIIRAIIINETNKDESPPPFQSFSSSSNKPMNSYIANPINEANQANHIQTFEAAKHVKPIEHIKPMKPLNEYIKPKKEIEIIPKQNNVNKPIKQHFKCSKVFYSNPRPSNNNNNMNPKPMNNINKNMNNKRQMHTVQTVQKLLAPMSPTQHIAELQKELDTSFFPEYLDGYRSLSNKQIKFLSCIKNNNLSQIKHMLSTVNDISSNINFGECQIMRECVLSDRLIILKYLKQKFVNEFDLNCESGYCLRWSSRKGLINIINYLLFEQKFQKVNISYFQFQAIEWSVTYGHEQIAKILQKYYRDWKLNAKWNVLQNSQENIGVEFDFYHLPSIYQQIIEIIIHSDENNNNIEVVKKYYRNGCDLCFANNMPWKVSSDCNNILMLEFLYSRVGVSPVCNGNYLLETALQNNSIQLLQFAKKIINWQLWKQYVEPNMYRLIQLCKENENLKNELQNYHRSSNNKNKNYNYNTPVKNKKNKKSIPALPQTPIPWPYENVKEKYGILTRSKRKLLIRKGILQERGQ